MIFNVSGIRKKIIVSFSVLIFCIILFQLVFSYYLMRKTVHNINNSYISIGLQQKNEQLKYVIDEIDELSKGIIANKDIQSLLLNNTEVDLGINTISPEIRYALSSTIEGLFLMSASGKVYKEVDVELEAHIQDNMEAIQGLIQGTEGEIIFLPKTFTKSGIVSDEAHFMVAARKVKSIETFHEIGIMVMVINESALWDIIMDSSDVGDFYITTDRGLITAAGDKKLIGSSIHARYEGLLEGGTLDGKATSYIQDNLIVNTATNERTGWKVINIVPISVLNANYDQMQNIIVLFGLGAIVIAVYLEVMISKKITAPIRTLIDSMKTVMTGKLDVQIEAPSQADYNELQELNNVFNKMTRELQYLIEQVYQEKIKKRELELRALKAQINPHFLYNTLDTIYWMLIDRGNEDVAQLVTKLGAIFRYSIKNASNVVSIGQEIEQVENYLFIQKARFEAALTYTIDVEAGILQHSVISFLIQPFVENAINHGIMDKKESGHVAIKGYLKEERLYFDITDDGIGMSRAQIDSIYDNEGDDKPTHTGIGIMNVHERIRYMYGEAYGVAIESEEGRGTKVTVAVPRR